MQEMRQNEVAKKVASDIHSLTYHYRRRATQIESIVSKLGGGAPLTDDTLGGDLRSLILAYKEENDALRMHTQTAQQQNIRQQTLDQKERHLKEHSGGAG